MQGRIKRLIAYCGGSKPQTVLRKLVHQLAHCLRRDGPVAEEVDCSGIAESVRGIPQLIHETQGYNVIRGRHHTDVVPEERPEPGDRLVETVEGTGVYHPGSDLLDYLGDQLIDLDAALVKRFTQ